MNTKEAIERIKTRFDKLALDNEDIEAFKTLIPELAESEDERIRKEIVGLIENNYACFRTIRDKELALAYLERLKEPKSLSISAASEWLMEHVSQYINSEYNEFHKCVEYDGSIDKERLINDFEDAMQKEQKPTELPKSEDYGVDGLYAAVDILQKTLGEVDGYQTDAGILEHKCAISAVKELYEQKPAEWSEEDEKMMRYVIGSIDTNISDSNFKIIRNWFESIKDRVQPRPKQEWSKEDDAVHTRILGAVAKAFMGILPTKPSEEDVHWLKTLPERFNLQPKQEWSEEDSDNLERVDNYLWMLDGYVGNDCATPQGKTDKIRGNIHKVLSPWLKSLPERFVLQPKQEWSEEDIDKKVNARARKSGATKSEMEFYRQGIKDTLKSLRPQPKQEWSKEEKECLDEVIELLENLGYDGEADNLKHLRPQPRQEGEPMEIKFAGKIYKVYGTKELPGGGVGYIIEDEPGHYDCIIRPEEVLGGGYGIKSHGSPYPTKGTNFSQPHWKPSEEQN